VRGPGHAHACQLGRLCVSALSAVARAGFNVLFFCFAPFLVLRKGRVALFVRGPGYAKAVSLGK
jgi:hypothetical protein